MLGNAALDEHVDVDTDLSSVNKVGEMVLLCSDEAEVEPFFSCCPRVGEVIPIAIEGSVMPRGAGGHRACAWPGGCDDVLKGVQLVHVLWSMLWFSASDV